MSDSESPRSKPSIPERSSYTCPGELYSIPRGIHLARLAAYYHKCRDCEHRSDAGHVFPSNHDLRRETPQRAATRTSLVTEESVRGVYLNELDRNRALAWGEAFAGLLWEQQPMVASREPTDNAQIVAEECIERNIPAKGPTVVVGFDERTSSPDIVTGAVLGLRRMGCPVIDLGQTALPTLAFNVQSLDAAGGLFVTGAGCNPSMTGFEFFTHGALPISYETLSQLEQAVKTGVGRQTRQIGGHSPRQGQDQYVASLEYHFHALRPLRVVCGSSTRLLRRTLDRLFAKLPCTVTHVELPTRRRDLFDGRDVDLQRVATVVVEGQQHLGMIIDEDGRHAAFITDRGRLVSPREVARLLIEFVQREHHAAEFVVSTSLLSDANHWLDGRNSLAIDGGETINGLVRLMIEKQAIVALSADGRVWFRQEYAACDALLVLACVLQALSLSDTPFSEVVARISRDIDGN
jgi:phosphomannomutase